MSRPKYESQYQAILRPGAGAASCCLMAGTTATGRHYGPAPRRMPGLQALFASSDAALLCNVGTLLEPISATLLASGSALVPGPCSLRSGPDPAVADQGSRIRRTTTGWGGRVCDLLQDVVRRTASP